jgi:hypothetical protein
MLRHCVACEVHVCVSCTRSNIHVSSHSPPTVSVSARPLLCVCMLAWWCSGGSYCPRALLRPRRKRSADEMQAAVHARGGDDGGGGGSSAGGGGSGGGGGGGRRSGLDGFGMMRGDSVNSMLSPRSLSATPRGGFGGGGGSGGGGFGAGATPATPTSFWRGYVRVVCRASMTETFPATRWCVLTLLCVQVDARSWRGRAHRVCGTEGGRKEGGEGDVRRRVAISSPLEAPRS